MNEKISVIVPIYNVEKYLKRCIDSILDQEYENFEIILVDDCSTDNSAMIAQAYALNHHAKCIFIKRERNGKLSAARNTGLKAATGKWITFVDSDDWVDKNYLDEMMKVAKADNADIVASSYYHAWENGRLEEINPFGNLYTNSSHKEKVALMRNHAVTRLYRKQLIDDTELKFPERIWRAAEMGFTIPMISRTDKISILKKPLYYYYQRKSSNSNNNNTNIDLTFYDKAFEYIHDYCRERFPAEIEYRAINEYMYGLISVMLKAKKPNSEIHNRVDRFNEEYSNWKNNKYIKQMAKEKRVFVYLASKKKIMALKILINLFTLKQSIINRVPLNKEGKENG
jgi:glycosyltransferase involved in cell wall biosynthesis